jgi:hypothetical protein
VLQNVGALFFPRIRGVRPLVSVNIPLDGGLCFSGLIAAPRTGLKKELAIAMMEIGKAATLVMLQPSAPAREPTAWIHAPSQPLT